MPHLRAALMGNAYVATGDEATSLFYNPAGLTGLRATNVYALAPQVTFNDPVKVALVDPEKFSNELDAVEQDLENNEFETLLGRSFFTDVTLRSPMVVFPDKGLTLGLGAEGLASLLIRRNRVLPLVRVEFFLDKLLVLGGFGTAGESFSWGFNLKVIDRIGVDKLYTPADFTTGQDITDRPEWQAVEAGESFTRGAADLGFLWRLPFARGWHPRVGVSMLNIGGYDSEEGVHGVRFGPRPSEFEAPQAGELPQINTVGFAVSPFWQGIRFTFALDVVDVTRSVLAGPDYGKRTRIGTEIGFFPHDDGTARLSLLAGWNGGHPSYGVLSRVWIFEVGFGVYTVELGEDFGDLPDERTTFTIAFRF